MSAARIAAIVCCLAAGVMATQQAAPRDAASATVFGAAVLSGRIVTDGASPRPVRRAVVTLSSSGTGAKTDLAAVTDDDGRFQFERLPGGVYSLVATKAAWVTSYFGGARPGRGPETPIAIADGQRLSVSMTMLPGAAIAGQVIDHTGHRRGASVRLLQWRVVDGVRSLVNVPAATGDRSEGYRFYGLAPGSYLVAARGGAPSDIDGHFQVSAAAIDAALRELASGRGPATPPKPEIASVVIGEAIGLAPTLYPSATDPEQATPVTVAAGEERDGIDIQLRAVKTANLAGMVVGPDGAVPRSLQVSLISPATALRLPGDLATPPAMSSQGGAFARGGLTPGHYTIFARGQEAARPGASGSGVNQPAGPGALTLWGRADFDLAGEDVPHLVVTLQRGRMVSGRIAFDASRLTPPKDLSTIQLKLVARAAAGFNLNVTPVKAASDGSFTFSGVPPGQYLVSVSVPAAGGAWSLDSARLGEADALDTTLTVAADRDVSDVVVTMTDRAPMLTGSLVDGQGRPKPEYTMVVFSADRRFWTPSSRRTMQQRPAHDGHFTFTGLPPGEYYIGAIAAVDPADLSDAAFLETLIPASTKVVVMKGETRNLDLEVKGTHGPY